MNETKQADIARSLGSSHTLPVKNFNLGSPLSWMHLAQEIKERLISTGGRPSDPCWKTKRLVPFKKETWDYLTDTAKEVSSKGRKVSPSQLAAIIIEDSLSQKL